MQLSNIPGKLVLPFANAGGKNAIPVASQIGITAGAASLVDGFPPLTRTPIAAGGVPPSGLDMNGIIYELSAVTRWANAGGGYPFDGTFAADTNVGGYPKGARIMRSDGAGYWFNTTDNNVTDPEGAGAAAAGWVPDFTTGVAAVTMASANITLTPAQYGKPVIVITGALTADLNLIFPNITGQWVVINNTTGGFAIIGKTSAGTGSLLGTVSSVVGDGVNIYSQIGELSAPNGSSLVGFIASASDAIARRMQDKAREIVSILDFGAHTAEEPGYATFDNSAAFLKARNYINGLGKPCRLVFPSGTYKYSSSPNWAIQDAQIVADGAVFLLYTGSSHAVILDGASTTNGNIYNCTFGKFLIAGPSTSLHGIYVTSLHHSKVGARVIGAGSASSGCYVKFAVCTEFDVQCTKNGQPGNAWYGGAQPLYGFYGTELNPGELLSYCTFINPILEHCSGTGMKLDYAFGNTVLAGTMEGNGSVGLFLSANSFNNKIYDVDFEVNTNHDVYCLGRENYIVNCDSDKQITFDETANNNTLLGGSHSKVLITANCAGTKLTDFVYNRNNDGSTITDLTGGKTYYRNLTDRVTNKSRNAPLEFSNIGPLLASPFIFENVTQNEVDVLVGGGTVSDITFIRALGLGFMSMGSSTGMIRLSPGDKVQVTYTVEPAMKLITR